MSDIPNTMWNPLTQNEEITLKQEGKEYITVKGKERERINGKRTRKEKKIERYNTELKADFGILQKQNVLMQSEFEPKLNEMSVDCKVKIKNHIHEFEKLQEATEK